ncbi:MAG: histidine--tRNA ligase [Muribaculaceae bacterium]
MAQKPSIPKGTRDFSPIEMAKRNYIFNTIKSVFLLYGYQQIETPAMENLSTLMGKYGEEGDKLLYKVLNSGDFLKSAPDEMLAQRDCQHLTYKMCEKGLRYDLTVPFARYVVQHRNELQFPFKRYQIQPVWRADRPQKGRYREFYQCDADVVGSDSLINEVELISIIDEVFARLGIEIVIKVNNRKVLSGIAEMIGFPDKVIDIATAIDKLDKIGLDNVNAELAERGISQEAIELLQPMFALSGSNDEKLASLQQTLQNSAIGNKGIEELRFVLNNAALLSPRAKVELDISLARGLNYYTGTILEVKACNVEMGSITGGGRYDNLTGVFGVDGLSGVGISFGADRIFDVLNTLDLYPADISTSTKVIFTNFGEKESQASLAYAAKLRHAGISAEIFPECCKIKKQMSYADAKKIPFVAIVGETELAEGVITLKDMTTGEQRKLNIDEIIDMLS